MMKNFLTALLVITHFLSYSQNSTPDLSNLPSLIPPSPEVASLANIGNMSVGMHTGSASVSIPLYELTVGSIKLPIALSYSTNGTRVNDIPSRTGLGWNLVAGGSISRVIHDEEDDGFGITHLQHPDFGTPSQAVLDYMEYAIMDGYDTERDEYSYSVNGMSGKFFLDENNVARIADHNNIKIEKGPYGFSLITAEGIVYKFGFAIEKTREVKSNGNPRAHKINTTAWFLKEIDSPEGDAVYFSYNAIYTKASLGLFQSVILKTLDPGYPYITSNIQECFQYCQGQLNPVSYNQIDYDTYYLSSITTSDAERVNFTYEDRPDGSGDNRLKQIYFSNCENKLIKSYQLEYDDYTVGTDLNQRFYLKKLTLTSTQSNENTEPEKLSHEFVYNDPSMLPSQLSRNQDFYGYAKGDGLGPDNFFPRIENYANYENGYMGIDRSPNFEFTKAGTLQKVIYPTGGYEEFTYEPHTLAQQLPGSDADTSWTYTSISGAGLGFSSENLFTMMVTPVSSFMRIQYNTEWNAASGPAPGSPGYNTPDGIHFISYLEIWKVSTNTMVYEARHSVYGGTYSHIQLEAGVQYQVKLRVMGNSHFSFASIKYNPVITPPGMTNTAVCGLRVKSIKYYEPVTDKVTSKYYTYASLSSLQLSSGVGELKPSFASAFQGGGVCHENYNDSAFHNVTGDIMFLCPGGLVQVSSSTISGRFTFDGSPVAYKSVIESDDPSFTNGGTVHEFYTYYEPLQPLNVVGDVIAGGSCSGPAPSMNGTELKTTIFKRVGETIIPLKIVENKYSYHPDFGYVYTENYIVRKRFQPSYQSNFSFSSKMIAYDVNNYIYLSKWFHLNSTVTTEYDMNGGNPNETTVDYSYSNTDHTQPTRITTTNSKEEVITQDLYYPADFTDPVSVAMQSKHIIDPLIRKTISNTNAVTSIAHTVYSAYNGENGNLFYKPELIKLQKGTGPLETRVHYYKYDENGSPLELSKDNDMHISYLWNYHKSQITAEVKNAEWGNIAYTGFEGDDDGRWSKTGTTLSTGLTGHASFTGNLQCVTKDDIKYVVVLWTRKPDLAKVNNQTGNTIAASNQWSLVKWVIENTNLVSVDGVEMDEVRLHPYDAQMTTFTYEPSIGLSAVCDVNVKPSWYFYDGFNRLSYVKGSDNNILKKYDYKYRQPYAPCNNTTPQWQQTGITKCETTANANYTGMELMQEKDMNTCSYTYLQERWVELGASVNCTPIPNCSGPDQRVVGGVCQTANKVLISSTGSGNSWTCMFKYVWTDGFESHSFIESHTQQCLPDPE